MNIALWICAGLLAGILLFAGSVKVIVPRKKLAATPGAGWTREVGDGFVKLLGVIEILGAAGLILPAVVGIAPVLVPLAATGVILLMTGAIVAHVRWREFKSIVAVTIYLLLAVFVAWGRFGPESFS